MCCTLVDFLVLPLVGSSFYRRFLFRVVSSLSIFHNEGAVERARDKQVTYGFKFKRDDPKDGIICFLTASRGLFGGPQKRQIVESAIRACRWKNHGNLLFSIVILSPRKAQTHADAKMLY